MSEYSPLKIIHHPRKLEILRNGGQIVPAQVHLIISDLCNQDCGFCAYRWSGFTSNALFGVKNAVTGEVDNNPNRKIPYTKVVEILDDCEQMGVGAIQLTGGGEPSVHPQFESILKDVTDRKMDLALVTNGVLLKESHMRHLMQASWLRISVDAGTPKVYSEIRRVGQRAFNQVFENIAKLSTMKAGTGSPVIIGVGFVMTKENWHEVQLCAQLARNAGADNIRISAVFQPDDASYFDEFYNRAKECVQLAKELETPSFRVFDNFGERHKDLVQQSPDYEFCGYQQFVSYIGGDLNVYRCCNTAYNPQGLLGSLKEQSFRTFWDSEQKKDKIKNFDARSCERCMFNNKNQVINYAIDSEPRHVNFV